MSTPFRVAARDYLESGWSPIPLPHNEKSPVPDQFPVGKKQEFTGARGVYVTRDHLKHWLKEKGRANAGRLSYPPGNIALRLPKNVLGIDVDAYSGKGGAETLSAAEEAWGALPPTWVSTSRDDGVSGIRLFRIPEGLAWPGQLPQGGGVELIRWDHRYCIVAPSTNPINDDAEYRWFREEVVDGEVQLNLTTDEIPAVEDLPELPGEWVEGLTSGAKWKDRAVDEEMDAGELNRWLAERADPDNTCSTMRATVSKYTLAIRKASDDGGVHDAGRDGAWAILGDAKAGHSGVIKALAELRGVFLAAVAGRRPDVGAGKAEWARIVLRGGQKVTADDNADVDEDPCTSLKELRPRREDGERIGSADVVWEFTDVGNAERLLRVMNDRARWIEALNTWALWGGDRWEFDGSRQVERWAVKAVNQMEEEIAHLEGDSPEEVIKAFRAHRKSSAGVGRLRAMVEVARGRKGIIVDAEEFDGNPRLLGVANGVLELMPEGVKLRRGNREDYMTLATSVRYVEGAPARLWEAFLKRVQPDQEVRAWLKRLAGYSLLGHNAERLLIALIGPTSTGKTTFASTVANILGPYAGPMPASVFRDNPDDKPRPDLLDALPRRFVVAEEMSAAQHLHADQMKRLTGGSVVAVRGMRANTYINRRPAFTPWIVANSTPTVNGADTALWRRLLVVPWLVPFAVGEEKAGYTDRLVEAEAEGILAWLVEGYVEYAAEVAKGGWLAEIPVGALDANVRFRQELSDIDVFLSEMTESGGDADGEYFVNRTQLYEEYVAWAERGNIKPLSSTTFGRELSGRGYGVRSTRIDGSSRYLRTGLRLKRSK